MYECSLSSHSLQHLSFLVFFDSHFSKCEAITYCGFNLYFPDYGQPVHPKGDQSWVFIGRTDIEAETPILWPPDVKSWLIWRDPDAGKDWGPEEKGMTEDEMVGWHHWLNGHGFGWTLGVGDAQGGLVCCNSWRCKQSETTEQLNWTETYTRY